MNAYMLSTPLGKAWLTNLSDGPDPCWARRLLERYRQRPDAHVQWITYNGRGTDDHQLDWALTQLCRLGIFEIMANGRLKLDEDKLMEHLL